VKLYTIGFTKKSAEQFFTKLCTAGVKRIIDVRLNNVSQLAGFAKRDDLRFFAKAVCGMGYVEQPELAPTKEILDAYKKDGGEWETYERKFLALMEKRRIEERVPRDVLDEGCLLCSEHKPHHCHRRLVAEYLQDKWGDIDIVHIE
jgi:uncharacterized protein (DUF488 family)